MRKEVILNNKSYKGSLKAEPAFFAFEQKQLNFELSYKGDPYRYGQYTLKVENCPLEELVEAPKPERPTFELARSEVKSNMTGTNPYMKFPFIVKGKFMYLLVTHNKRTKFTKVQLGKHCATVKGKKLNQDGVWPIVMVCTELQLKVAVVYEAKHNTFIVKVDD